MSLAKLLFGLVSAILAGIITYLALTSTQSALLVFCLGIYAVLSYKKPFFGLCLILLLPVLGEFSRFDFLGKSIVLSDLIIPIFEIVVLLKYKKTFFHKNLRLILLSIFTFLSIALFSLLFSFTVLTSGEVLQSALYLIRLTLYLGLFPISYLIISAQNIRQLIVWIAVSAILVAISGFIQMVYLPSLEQLSLTSGYDPHINRLVGSWLDPNFIGGFFAIISLVLLSLSLYERKQSTKIFYWLTTGILLAALFLTYSRSAYLAFATGILVLGLIKGRRLLLIFLIIGTLGIAVSDRAQQRVGELVTSVNSILFETSENPDPTARLRLQNWQDTWGLIDQKPFLGHGYNTLSFIKLNQGLITDQQVHSASGSDSSLLTILVTTGIIGLLTFLFILFLLFQETFHSWYNSKHTTLQKGFGLGLFAGSIALLVHSSFVNSLLFPQIMIYFWILVSIQYTLSTNKRSE